jgi:splicing factor 3A subunit 2
MDFQHREGGKTGTGGLLSASESNADRRERLRKLALETIDLSRDPYFLKNHLGSYECRLCLTLHVNEGSYLVHTQGKKHQSNLGRRRAREASMSGSLGGAILTLPQQSTPSAPPPSPFITGPKLGRPGYKLCKIRDPVTRYLGLRIQVHYAESLATQLPRPLTRLMSAFEQRQEAPNKLFQYLLLAAPPYETVCVKVPAKEIYSSWSYWDEDTRLFTHEMLFK